MELKMAKLENKKYSFWEILQKVGIKIPIIQRDYAQGRDNKKLQILEIIFWINHQIRNF